MLTGVRSVFTVLVCLLVAIVVVSCGKKQQPATTPPPTPTATAPATPPAPPPPPAPTPPPAPAPLSEDEVFARKSIDDLNREGVLADAFFDYDQSVIREDAKATLTKNASWLKRWTGVRFTVEGHADERGTSEYNLSLGERRANAAKNYLVGLGIAGDRIRVVSMGKEQPQCTESNDGCWAKNRRGHSVVTAK